MAKYIVKTLVVLGKNNKKFRLGEEVTQADMKMPLDELVAKRYLKIVDGEAKEESLPEPLKEETIAQPKIEAETIIAPVYKDAEESTTTNILDDAFGDAPTTTKKGKK